jgi:hypothetical protein
MIHPRRDFRPTESWALPIRGSFAADTLSAQILCPYPKHSADNSEREFVYWAGIGFFEAVLASEVVHQVSLYSGCRRTVG